MDFENDSTGMLGLGAERQEEPVVPENRSDPVDKPRVVGLYGVPGSGKTFLLKQLEEALGTEHYAFYDGSGMIDTVVPGGLDMFQKMEEPEKMHWRQVAIDTIRKQCADSKKVAVVAGHFMFWNENEKAPTPICTPNDLDTYTHILYLDVSAEFVALFRRRDKKRSRPFASVDHLRRWQTQEKTQLRDLCRENGILFSLIARDRNMVQKASTLLRDFRIHSEAYNLTVAKGRLHEAFVAGRGQLSTVLFMDADKTLAAEDTGKLFWNQISDRRQNSDEKDALHTLFGGPLGYSYTAFRQAVLLYEETVGDVEFEEVCQEVASAVHMYPEFVSILQLVGEQAHVGAVIGTCGLRRVWEKVLEREGLSKTVRVIGGGRVADGFVVTAGVKAALVRRLRDDYEMHVWAFGDSPLDLEMMREANEAIVVVGSKWTRSSTMEAALSNAIDNGGLRARQAILPSDASPRLDTTRLPTIQLTGHEFIDAILGHRHQIQDFRVLHATDRNAAKLLMSPMRDAKVAGPMLREAHRQVGWYLATEFLAEVIGVEEYPIRHVQGRETSGHRLLHEGQTSIVALMRGGEPMALGVSDAFPLAMFYHAIRPEDIKPHCLQGQLNVVLVDSVVNSGKTVVEFIRHVRSLHATIRIVIVTGVAPADCASGSGLVQELATHGNLSLVALRLSENKFTGTRTTDTGNRLFNTTHLV